VLFRSPAARDSEPASRAAPRAAGRGRWGRRCTAIAAVYVASSSALSAELDDPSA